jgi:hypothetical protein
MLADATTCDRRISHDFALSLIRVPRPFFAVNSVALDVGHTAHKTTTVVKLPLLLDLSPWLSPCFHD